MAEGADPSILQLTPDEKRVYSQLFQQADTDNLGVVTGEVAVKFFEKTKLAPNVLGEIWQLSDTENRGLLTKAGFCVALRLIAHYQAGRDPSSELAFKPAPLPKFDGVNLQPASPITSNAPPNALQPQGSGIRIPPILPEKAAQYSSLFDQSGPQNGNLSGEQSKAIFERAGLPNEVLGRVWGLADREQKGGLDITEFIIAMHLITSYKSRKMTAIPSALPPGLYEAAQRRGQPVPRIPGPPTAVPRQFTGSQRTSSPLARPFAPAPQQIPQTTGPNWLVTPQEKVKYDQFFDNIDTSRSGFLTGDQAVTFFNDSALPEDTLAAIWDLADIRTEGRLNKDEFAVAMYLIRQQRTGASLPAFLPAALVPPSMRSQPQAQAQAPAQQTPQQPNAFDTSVHNTPQATKSAADDLFGLDSSPVKSSPAPVQTVQTTGNNAASRSPFDSDPFASAQDKAPAAAGPQSTGQGAGLFRPFQPTSAFGASLTHQNTGGSGTSSSLPNRSLQQSQQFPQPSANDDLLGDNDEEQSKKLNEDTTELANMSTQIGNLRNQMQDVQSKRSTNERDVSAASTQKQELQQRLAQFRSQYESEVQIVKSLEAQLATSRNDTKKLQQEFAMIEGTHQDLQAQHAQVAQALEADKTENASLKSKISQLNSEISQLRPQIEKMRSEARQQKGMVAINKKQLATNEGERDKLNSEMSDLSKSAEMSKAAELEQSRSATPTASVVSPAASTRTNPFFRSTQQPGPGEPLQSPNSFLASGPSPSAFDSIFGPAAVGTSTPPQVSFSKAEGSVSSGVTGSPPQGARSPAVDAPPVPESRQFTPHMLPIYPVGSKGGSVTSSTRAAPPASAVDGVAGRLRPDVTGESSRDFAASPFDEDVPTPAATQKAPESEPASALTLAHDAIPGAFPSEASPQKSSTPVQPFPPVQKPDFDAAFADLDREPHGSDGHTDVFGPRGNAGKKPEDFYPMTEPADDSSSDDDDDNHERRAAFDDNFGTPTPKTNGGAKPAASAAAAAPAPSEIPIPRPNLESQPTGEPPNINAQVSPPAYAPRKDSRPGFPDEFEGLLPSRDDPTASPHLHSVPSNPQNAQTTGGSSSYFSSAASDVFHDSSSRPLSGVEADNATSAAHHATPTAPKQPPTSSFPAPAANVRSAAPAAGSSSNAFDDSSFDDFADLSEAKADDPSASAFDKFDFSDNASVAEFNPSFDSPAASMMTTTAGGGGGLASSQQTPVPAANGFHDFGGGPRKDRSAMEDAFAARTNSGSSAGMVGRATSGAHDWDAIFSGLGSGSGEPAPADGLTAGGSAAPAAPVASAGKPAVKERSMSEDSEGDDPILRKLTRDLGYARPQALAALEATGYDINAAIDRLSKAS